MTIFELSRKDFDEFAFKHPYRIFYQTSQYGTLMSKHGYKPLYIGYGERGYIKAAALILIKSKFGLNFGYSPRGYLIDFNDYQLLDDFTNELKRYLSSIGITYLIIDPHITHLERNNNGAPIQAPQKGVNISEYLKRIGYDHMGFNLYFENLKPRWNMILKTEKSSIKIFNSFEKATRTKIRNSLRKGVEVYKGTKDDLKLFYQIIDRKHYRKYDYYLDIYQIFGQFDMFDIYFARINTETYLKNSKLLYEYEVKNNNKLANLLQNNIKNEKDRIKLLNKKMQSDKLLNSYKNDIIAATKLYKERKYIVIATNAVIKYGNEIFFLIDGINMKFKSFNPNHLLKWKIIEEYRNNGYTKFNFNGITGDFSNKNKYIGLFKFKKGFSAVVTEYIGEYMLVTNKAKYSLYTTLKPLLNINKNFKK